MVGCEKAHLRSAREKALSLCFASLSQKLKAPSPPEVEKVPALWNEMQLTKKT